MDGEVRIPSVVVVAAFRTDIYGFGVLFDGIFIRLDSFVGVS